MHTWRMQKYAKGKFTLRIRDVGLATRRMEDSQSVRQTDR